MLDLSDGEVLSSSSEETFRKGSYSFNDQLKSVSESDPTEREKAEKIQDKDAFPDAKTGSENANIKKLKHRLITFDESETYFKENIEFNNDRSDVASSNSLPKSDNKALKTFSVNSDSFEQKFDSEKEFGNSKKYVSDRQSYSSNEKTNDTLPVKISDNYKSNNKIVYKSNRDSDYLKRRRVDSDDQRRRRGRSRESRKVEKSRYSDHRRHDGSRRNRDAKNHVSDNRKHDKHERKHDDDNRRRREIDSKRRHNDDGHRKRSKHRESSEQDLIDRRRDQSSRSGRLRSRRDQQNDSSPRKRKSKNRKRPAEDVPVQDDVDMGDLEDLVDMMENVVDENALLEKRRLERQKILEKHSKLSKCENASQNVLNSQISGEIKSIGITSGNSIEDISLYDQKLLEKNYSLDGFDSLPTQGEGKLSPPSDDPNEELILEKNQEELIPLTSELQENANSKNNDDDDDKFDMFAENFDIDDKNKLFKLDFSTKLDTTKMIDTGDDLDGYYKVVIGELMISRYSVYGLAGRGVFSNVIRARDVNENDKEVAIKMLRNNDLMKKQGIKELEILKAIRSIDVKNVYHCVVLLDDFKHKHHLCLVFEALNMNLRELIKKYGSGVGLNMKAVRTYSHQLLQALKLLRRLNIIHADIKPDNVMVNYQKNSVKLCDFGSACFSDEAEITPYLVSRFYRAPEIIMGLKYDTPIDLWSIGCTIYEMYTGKILFPAKTNNEMLKFFMDLKGKISHKMIRKSTFGFNHFDENYNFIYRDFNKATQTEKITINTNVQAVNNLYSMLTRNQKLEEPIKKKAVQLKELLEKMLILDPSKRITVGQALQHSFITEKAF